MSSPPPPTPQAFLAFFEASTITFTELLDMPELLSVLLAYHTTETLYESLEDLATAKKVTTLLEGEYLTVASR